MNNKERKKWKKKEKFPHAESDDCMIKTERRWKPMATKLLKKNIPLEIIFSEPIFILLHIGDIFEYQDGHRTEKVIGTYYEVVDTMDFSQIRVRIPKTTKPLMSEDELQERRLNGERIYVEFINGVDRPYLRMTGTNMSVEDSFSADDVKLVETLD